VEEVQESEEWLHRSWKG